MLWFWLALGSAVSISASDALTKKYFSDLTPMEMGFMRLLYCAPLLIVPFLMTPAPPLPPLFWIVVAAAAPFEALALYLYMKSLQTSPMSLTVPFLAFTPVWVMFTGFFILGELPSAWGAAGICLVGTGAYALNIDARRNGVLGPLKAVLREPGSWMMLIVSAIYAVTLTLGKKAILLSSVMYFGTMYFLLLTAVLGLLLMATGQVRLSLLAARPGRGLAVGAFNAAMILTHVWAISLTSAAYMVSVKRLSLVFAVLYGRFLFKEPLFGQRLAGAVVMFAGLALITLLG